MSKQTGDPTVMFVENSGLAEVISIDVIKETVDLAISSVGPAGFFWQAHR